MQARTKYRRLFVSFAIIFLVTLSILIGFAYYFTITKSQSAIDEVSEAYMKELSEVLVANLDAKLASRINELRMMDDSLDMAEPFDRTFLQEFLIHQGIASGFNAVSALDQDGGCYTSNSPFSVVCSPEKTNQVISQGARIYSGAELIELGVQVDPVLIYVVLPVNPIPFEGTNLVALIGSVDTATVERNLGNHVGNARSSIVTLEGTYVVFSSIFGHGKVGDSLFDLLDKHTVFDEGYSFEQMLAAMENEEPYMASLTFDGNHEYLYITPFYGSDWYLSTVMPYSVIDTPISGMIQTLIQNTSAVVVAIVCGVVVLGILYVRMTREARRLLEDEKRRAELATEKAEHASMAKGEFLSRMSHEIRTPLNAIIGMTDIALNNCSDEEKVAECLKKITVSSGHLLSLINDILDMSKIESGQMVIQPERFDFKTFIESLTMVFHTQARGRGIDYETILVGDVDEFVVGDSLRLNQILYNLLSNAMKFTPEGGSVTLRVSAKDYWLRFEVSDTGSGIRRENLDKIFDSFEQENASVSRKYGGTGLGLAITKRFVEMMGGVISVRSEFGRGSTFTVELPLNTTNRSEPIKNYGNLRVLVADRNKDTRAHISLLLRKAGIAATDATNSMQAVSIAERAFEKGVSFDICFIDWKLGDRDGVEVGQRIRNLSKGVHSPIVFLMAYDISEVEPFAKEGGIRNILKKPLFESTLIEALNRAKTCIDTNDGQDCGRLDLGVGRELEEASDKASPDVDKGNDVGYDFSGKHILIVEDNELNLEIVVELIGMTGATIETAVDGEEAVAKFAASEVGYYDLILMDVQMPKMDGYEATKAIRAFERPDAQTIPIFAMTANAFMEDEQRSLESGMNSHISKPLDIRSVYSKMNEYFSREDDE